LTAKFLQNNVADKPWEKCYERYAKYEPIELGGPLFFRVMLLQLVSNSEDAGRALLTRLENLSISDVPGENIEKAVSQIRGAIERLKHIKRLPEDLIPKLLKIFQTTSVDDFNASFSLLEKQRMLNSFATSTGGGNSLKLSLFGATEAEIPDKLCNLAESLYVAKVETGEWSGAKTKGKKSAFVTDATPHSGPTCWNCGTPGHTLQACTQAKNKTAIATRKKAAEALWKANASSGGRGRGDGGRGRGRGRGGGRGDGRERPAIPNFPVPTTQENNKRVIDGKPMFYIKSRNTWVLDKYPPSGPAVNLATPEIPQQPAALVSTASNAAARQQAIDVAVANATRSMGSALSGLAEQFRN
jgi:hypothetical protein